MAEEANTTDKDQDTTTQNEDNSTAEKPEKTFTQADVDKIVSDRLARERSKMPSADELKAFGEWKKSQQTEAEKAAERERALAEAQARSEELKRELLVSRAGVKAEDADFVIFKVAKMDGDFEQNLAKFLSENTRFTEPETEIVSGQKHNPSTPETMSGVERAFLKRNPGLKVDE
ncbi:MAG TPA: hypothetical protein PLU23_01585 [Anaerolineaceae bacterium]|nr:hypothetical protein [Anaerolineaceae bacterium]